VNERNSSGDWAIAVAIALILFALYSLGACRSIYVGDSGELVAAVHVLGIPHPSGYPLYVLLGKLWTLLVPVGPVAFRMSLFSAACAAAACAVLFLVARRLGCARPAALLTALLLAFSPSFWGEANVQRVYALNALFVAVATALALEWWIGRRPRVLVATTLVCALGATNHTFMAVFGVTFGSFALATEPAAVLRLRTIAAVLIAGLLGLLPYAYLPIASSFDPPLDWGNPETFDSFLAVLERRDFWARAWIESAADLLPIAADHLLGVGRELAWGGAVLAIAGLWSRRSIGFQLFLLAVVAANLAVMALHGSRSDLFIWHRYYIPSYAMVAVLAGVGTDRLAKRWGRTATIAAFVLPGFLLVSGWKRFDRSDYRIAEDFSRILLSTIPPGASLAATDDNILFVLIYLTMVEGVRPDVNLILQGVGGATPGSLRFDPETEPLYFTHHPNWNHPDLDVVPTGLAFRVWRRGAPPPPIAELPEDLPGANDPDVPKDYLTQNLIGQYYFMQGFTAERTDWPRAVSFFERATQHAPDNDVLFYNIGLIYERNGHLDQALAAFRRSNEINPRHIAGASRVRASDKIAQLEEQLERKRLQPQMNTDEHR
jgi:tetratricopeptide (TPR) repeat protein